MSQRNIKLLVYCLFCFSYLKAQDTDAWYAFEDNQTTLTGYKNQYGEVMLAPKFLPHFSPARLDNIMAVTDSTGKSYYLTKSGKKIAKDSVYILDATFDCECEGFIRFQNRANEKVGLLNKNGEVVIPAIYDALSQVNNGMVVGWLNASKELLHPLDSGCQHFVWQGGKIVLTDTTNHLLIDNFKHEQTLNLYSLQKSKKPTSGPVWFSQIGKDDLFYNFVDFEKEFRHWLDKMVLENMESKNLQNLSFDSITFWNQKSGWITKYKKTFWHQHYASVKTLLTSINDTQFEIFQEGLNPYIFSGKVFQKYFNNCKRPLESRYPVFNLVISHHNNEKLIQDHLSFLRTDEGYRLISMSIKSLL